MRSTTAGLLCVLVLTGCSRSVGPVDEQAALEVVYDSSGVPAFAGQALAIQSCGAGGFCHSADIEAEDRFGAPHGLNLDVRLASTTVEVEQEALDRLVRDQDFILQNRVLLWEQVSSLRMPPAGAVGERYRDAVGDLGYDRFDDSGEAIGPLPGLDTEEGREIFRNWLAAAVPVVERTQRRVDRQPTEGWPPVPLCERGCVDPTWESIYVQIVRPSCALSSCHDEAEPASDRSFHVDLGDLGDLTMDELGALVEPLRESLVGDVANESECRLGGHELIVPGDPEISLLYRKVAPARTFSTETECTAATVEEDCGGLPLPECTYPESSGWSCPAGTCTYTCEVCGAVMPASGNPLTEQRLCAIREWIACGACGPGDASCDACIETARGMCGVGAPFDLATGTAECAIQQPCPNRPPP